MAFPYKCVLVSGATSGIGQALTEKLIQHGSFVIAVGRRQERLENLSQQYGSDKIATECFDVSKIDALSAWVAGLTTKFPQIDAILLNAGFQHHPCFLAPESLSLETMTSELHTNYLSPLHTSLLFLPHLQRLSLKQPTAIIFVTSGLALVPSLRAPTYSATKSALHTLAWTLRATLADDYPALKVVEIIPPAVKTELHTTQGQPQIGMPLEEFIHGAWSGLLDGQDEIPVGAIKEHGIHVEDERKAAFANFCNLVKAPRPPEPSK
ncbi:hypothetical protein QQS21_001274 [Conoideocrella luteorostrata]|uniref:Uncharacterized protein n=1 Tax=Conoideocrella luteorostrata TaxID=1105319 RepID=A0AAJ0FXM3_9HYPO|nr:hypothetical protein QQS21_001274 [Conoideocrella luteorostrata]